MPNKFYVLIYEDHDLTIFKDFRIEKRERAVETPGKTELFTSFEPFFTYYALINEKKLSRFKLNKKSVIGLFEESKEMSQSIGIKASYRMAMGCLAILSVPSLI